MMRPVAVSLVTVTSLLFLCSLPGTLGFLLIPITVLGTPAFGIGLLVWSLILFFRRRPRKAISILFALLAPVLLFRPIIWVSDCLHLGLTVGFGLAQLGPNKKPDSSQILVADWSTGLAGGPDTFLLHDSSDQVALPESQHTRPDPLQGGVGEDCSGKVRRVLGHYYVCDVQF